MSEEWGDSEFSCALRSLIDPFSAGIPAIADGDTELILPTFHLEFMIRLMRSTGDLFAQEPTILDLSGPLVIIGDLHGQLLDLTRILQTYGPPGDWKYLFLGDLVDRGEFSIEVVIVVFLMKAIFPRQVFLIRGIHEFSGLCSQHGFLSQVIETYHISIYEAALTAFDQIPLGAVIDEKALCLHAGIGPEITSVAQIRELRRPIVGFSQGIDSLVWSDPSEKVETFEPSPIRGIGYLFGKEALFNFLESSNMQLLIRAHECVSGGYRYSLDERVLTVFSASNYGGVTENPGAVLEYRTFEDRTVRTFPPLRWLHRDRVIFRSSEWKKVMCPNRPRPVLSRTPPPRAKPKAFQPLDVNLRPLEFSRSLATLVAPGGLPTVRMRSVHWG
jgi:protein phosphatase